MKRVIREWAVGLCALIVGAAGVFAFLVLLVTLIEPHAEAAELTKDQAQTLYVLAQRISALPQAETPPEIHMTTAAAIEAQLVALGVCPRGCPSVKAAQIEGRVYVDLALDMDDTTNASIVFHELVHFLQWANHGEAKTCQEWRDRELQAYQLQNLLLNKAGVRMAQVPQMPTCPAS